MNIDRSRELLHDYARGKLSEQDRTFVEEQLLNSEELRQELEMAKSYYGAIDEIDPVSVPSHFLEKVHQRIDARAKRSLLNRLRFPLHMKLPIEFAGVVATVTLIIFIFMPHLEKKNYSEYKPVIASDVPKVSSASKDEVAGEPVPTNSRTEENLSREIERSGKTAITDSKNEGEGAPLKQRPKSSVPRAFKSSPAPNAGVKKVDEIESVPAAAFLSDNAPVPASVPAPAPEPARQSVTENTETNKSEYTAAMPAVVQEDEPLESFSKSEDNASERKRKIISFEKRRMKSRTAYSEKTDTKEVASTIDSETTLVSKKITTLLAKYGMKWTVKEFTGRTSTCSASGSPASVRSFLKEVKELSDVTLLRVVPENYNAALDSVIVEFSVKGKVE